MFTSFSAHYLIQARKHLDKNKNLLRLNVGFLLKEGIGYSREITFEEPEVPVSDDLTVTQLRGTVTFTRTPQGLYAKGRLQAVITEACVLCLTDVLQPLSAKIDELFIYPPEAAPEDALQIGDDAHLDLAPLVREDMLLSKPIRILCRPDCKGLCPQCGQNWNEGPCHCQTEPADSPWGPLANLKEKPADTD